MDEQKSNKGKVTPALADTDKTEQARKLWAARGVEDVYYQREAQVTWWTILGGIAVGAVLTRLEAVPDALRAGQWQVILYLLATLLIIINSWVQTTWGSLLLRWPLSIPTALFISIQGISMSVAALSVFKPAVWYTAITVVLVTALLNQFSFSKTRAWETLPEVLVKRAKIGILIYFFMGVFSIVSCFLLFMAGGETLEKIWGIIAFGLSTMALVWQHLGMTEEKRMMGIP